MSDTRSSFFRRAPSATINEVEHARLMKGYKQQQAQVLSDVEQFIASGGCIQEIPPGRSGWNSPPSSTHVED